MFLTKSIFFYNYHISMFKRKKNEVIIKCILIVFEMKFMILGQYSNRKILNPSSLILYIAMIEN